VRINTPKKTKERQGKRSVGGKKGENEGNRRGGKFIAEREKCREEFIKRKMRYCRKKKSTRIEEG
jgi:hypothetical protein